MHGGCSVLLRACLCCLLTSSLTARCARLLLLLLPLLRGGNVISLSEVPERAQHAKDFAGSAKYGIMLWSIHKQGCPNAQQITSAVCTMY